MTTPAIPTSTTTNPSSASLNNNNNSNNNNNLSNLPLPIFRPREYLYSLYSNQIRPPDNPTTTSSFTSTSNPPPRQLHEIRPLEILLNQQQPQRPLLSSSYDLKAAAAVNKKPYWMLQSLQISCGQTIILAVVTGEFLPERFPTQMNPEHLSQEDEEDTDNSSTTSNKKKKRSGGDDSDRGGGEKREGQLRESSQPLLPLPFPSLPLPLPFDSLPFPSPPFPSNPSPVLLGFNVALNHLFPINTFMKSDLQENNKTSQAIELEQFLTNSIIK